MSDPQTEGQQPSPQTTGETEGDDQAQTAETPGYVEPSIKQQAHQDDVERLQQESA
jgi:hypothetical protein